jgi:hypothetical protein
MTRLDQTAYRACSCRGTSRLRRQSPRTALRLPSCTSMTAVSLLMLQRATWPNASWPRSRRGSGRQRRSSRPVPGSRSEFTLGLTRFLRSLASLQRRGTAKDDDGKLYDAHAERRSLSAMSLIGATGDIAHRVRVAGVVTARRPLRKCSSGNRPKYSVSFSS